MMRSRSDRRRLVMVALLALGVGVGAGEFARIGTYSGTAESVGSFEVVQLTEGVGAAVYRYEITLHNTGESSFLQGVLGHCIGLGIYESALDHESGYCVFRDSDADLYFERYEHYGQIGRGSGSAIGGTGKYDGITASHEYRFDAVNTPDATEFTSTAQRTGRYRLRRESRGNAGS